MTQAEAIAIGYEPVFVADIGQNEDDSWTGFILENGKTIEEHRFTSEDEADSWQVRTAEALNSEQVEVGLSDWDEANDDLRREISSGIKDRA